MKLSRFERKILAAMALVALAPLLGALLLGRAALQNAYRAGVNPRVREQLDRGVGIYRAHLVTLRADAERTADAVAGSATLRDRLEADDRHALDAYLEEIVDRYDPVSEIVLRRGDTVLARVSRPDRADPEERRALLQSREVPLTDGSRVDAEITVTAPREVFDDFQRAGEEAEVFARLQEQATYISAVYVWVFVGFMALLIVAVLVLAAVLSRRLTRRVIALAEATRRLGGGDLSVSVPREARDEVGELTEAFNNMVHDLRESQARIEYLQRIGAWQDFARRLAHEIKNPLTPIQLAAQEMHRSYDGSDEKFRSKLEDARSIIEEEVETLRRLVSEFSNFAKLPAAALAKADLRDFLQDIARSTDAIRQDVFEDAAQDGNAPEVHVALLDEALPVQVDAMMLKRCVDNLVRNALQAMRAGEGTRVDVLGGSSEQGIFVAVDDDGPGIPKDRRETIFDPYFTTKVDGTGLGLAIVKKVVLEHGGEIEFEPSSRGGARFTIWLPSPGVRRPRPSSALRGRR